MFAMPRSQLTESTFKTLEAMLDDTIYRDEAFRRLLHNKLSNATIVSPERVAPQVATINSRIDFSVGRNWMENRILVRGDGVEVFGLHLPITTLRGLALLGLTAGEAIEVARSDGAIEILCLAKVCFQPEAQQKRRCHTVPGIG